jgi:hypothetical protein
MPDRRSGYPINYYIEMKYVKVTPGLDRTILWKGTITRNMTPGTYVEVTGPEPLKGMRGKVVTTIYVDLVFVDFGVENHPYTNDGSPGRRQLLAAPTGRYIHKRYLKEVCDIGKLLKQYYSRNNSSC